MRKDLKNIWSKQDSSHYKTTPTYSVRRSDSHTYKVITQIFQNKYVSKRVLYSFKTQLCPIRTCQFYRIAFNTVTNLKVGTRIQLTGAGWEINSHQLNYQMETFFSNRFTIFSYLLARLHICISKTFLRTEFKIRHQLMQIFILRPSVISLPFPFQGNVALFF